MKRNTNVEIIHERLESYFSADREQRPAAALLRLIEDPLRPRTRNDQLRPNPIFLLLVVLAILAFSTFLYFSFGGL
jgi:hypothetical protein